MTNFFLTSDYATWLKELKLKIRRAQVKAALAANRELILFYWELGGDISQKLTAIELFKAEGFKHLSSEQIYREL